jgi:hypothetical protein
MSKLPHRLILLPVLVAAAIGLRLATDKMRGTAAPDGDTARAAEPGPGEPVASPGMVVNEFASLKPAEAHEKPILVIDQTQIDAGEVARNDVQHYVFNLKNQGVGPLELRVKTGCNCTVAKFDKTIAPGAEGKIEADLRLNKLKGKVQKVIEVRTNDPDRPKVELVIRATVRPQVQVEPAETTSLVLTAGTPAVQEFTLKLREGDPTELAAPTCSAAHATAALTAVQDDPEAGRTYRLTVTVGPGAPTGSSVLTVTVPSTTPGENPTQVRLLCEKGILVAPTRVSFPSPGPGSAGPLERVVLLRKQQGTFQVRKVECADPNLVVRQEVIKAGIVQLFLTPCAGKPLRPASVVRVETDDPGQPAIEIQVRAAP